MKYALRAALLAAFAIPAMAAGAQHNGAGPKQPAAAERVFRLGDLDFMLGSWEGRLGDGSAVQLIVERDVYGVGIASATGQAMLPLFHIRPQLPGRPPLMAWDLEITCLGIPEIAGIWDVWRVGDGEIVVGRKLERWRRIDANRIGATMTSFGPREVILERTSPPARDLAPAGRYDCSGRLQPMPLIEREAQTIDDLDGRAGAIRILPARRQARNVSPSSARR
jgi:hypothetical protein